MTVKEYDNIPDGSILEWADRIYLKIDNDHAHSLSCKKTIYIHYIHKTSTQLKIIYLNDYTQKI